MKNNNEWTRCPGCNVVESHPAWKLNVLISDDGETMEVGEIDFSRQDIPEKDKQEIAKTVMQILSRTLIAEPVRNEKLIRASAEVKHKTGVSVNFIMKGATE